MARRQILSLSERESLLALPDDELTLTRMAYFSEHDLALIWDSSAATPESIHPGQLTKNYSFIVTKRDSAISRFRDHLKM
jgi:hypothetical protein